MCSQITIPNAATNQGDAGVPTDFCGTTISFGATDTVGQQIRSSMAPFTLGVFTGGVSQLGSDGFALDYRQVPC